MRLLFILGAMVVLASCSDDSSLTAPTRRNGASSGSNGSSGSSGDEGSSGSSGDEGSSGSSGDVNASGGTLSELCFNTINEYRKQKSLPPLTRWTAGESCAEGQAKSDAETNKPHGSFPRCGEFAQNECPGNPGPTESSIKSCLNLMWKEGPGGGHYDNMASTKWKQAACGIYVTPKGAVWAVQNFK